MPMHGPRRHLEVHIWLRRTRAVVTDANPTIVLVDNTAHGLPHRLPVAVMEGIGEGRADLHYGNNVAMSHHHRYTITVACAGQRATLHLKARSRTTIYTVSAKGGGPTAQPATGY
jgi:hypothetical protein